MATAVEVWLAQSADLKGTEDTTLSPLSRRGAVCKVEGTLAVCPNEVPRPILSQWSQTMAFIPIASLNPHTVVSSTWPVFQNHVLELGCTNSCVWSNKSLIYFEKLIPVISSLCELNFKNVFAQRQSPVGFTSPYLLRIGFCVPGCIVVILIEVG